MADPKGTACADRALIILDAMDAAEEFVEQGFSENPDKPCAWEANIITCEEKLGRVMTGIEGALWLSVFKKRLSEIL